MDKGHTSTALILNLPTIDKTNLVFAEVYCCGLKVKALIDTGAGITVVSPLFCSKLKLNYFTWDGPTILYVNGKRVVPEGQVELEISIRHKEFKIKAAVLDLNGFDLLLGNDSLKLLKSIRVDYVEGGENQLDS